MHSCVRVSICVWRMNTFGSHVRHCHILMRFLSLCVYVLLCLSVCPIFLCSESRVFSASSNGDHMLPSCRRQQPCSSSSKVRALLAVRLMSVLNKHLPIHPVLISATPPLAHAETGNVDVLSNPDPSVMPCFV